MTDLCDGYDWRSGSPRECALTLGHRGLCSGGSTPPNPLGPHVQVITGWLDDNGCLLPDEDGIAYKRTFTDWEECADGE